jgi:hypothetical protein
VAKQYFHGGTQALDLHFAVEAALLAADAVKHLGDVEELGLDLSHDLVLLSVALDSEEELFFERVLTANFRVIQEPNHKVR